MVMIDSSIETARETIRYLQIGQFMSRNLFVVLYHTHVGFSSRIYLDGYSFVYLSKVTKGGSELHLQIKLLSLLCKQ